jgi:hypothetical protein
MYEIHPVNRLFSPSFLHSFLTVYLVGTCCFSGLWNQIPALTSLQVNHLFLLLKNHPCKQYGAGPAIRLFFYNLGYEIAFRADLVPYINGSFHFTDTTPDGR